MKPLQLGTKITDPEEIEELTKVIEWRIYTGKSKSVSDFLKQLLSAGLKSSLEKGLALRKPTDEEYQKMLDEKQKRNLLIEKAFEEAKININEEKDNKPPISATNDSLNVEPISNEPADEPADEEG